MSGRPFLSRLKIVSFGAFSNLVVGPLSPHLNVVFGRNEAGKTTLASFIGGVLFGWEEARGTRNTYKPGNAERSGTLFFAPGSANAAGRQGAGLPGADADGLSLSRVRNADGLQGDAFLVEDIDKETFQTMFSLTSDELRSLRNTTDVTAKLLTAGSGTGASPAAALAAVQAKLAEYTSRASGIGHSLVRLASEQEELRGQLAQATEEAERFKRQDKELHELSPQRDGLLERIDSLNTQIEALSAYRASAEKLDRQIASLAEEAAQLREEEASLSASRGSKDRSCPDLSAAEERALRDRIEALAAEQAKRTHSADLAKESYATSKAAYEALLETSDVQELEAKSRRQRRAQVVLSVALPLVFVASGVPVFMHGRQINSLSFTALGVALVLFALLLAGGALVMLFRPNKVAEELESRKQDLQWVMLQDKKKLESCRADQEQLEARIREALDGAGLAAAEGSLRRARSLLDEAREARAEGTLFAQRQQAVAVRLAATEEALAEARRQREAVFEHAGLRQEPTLAALEAAIARKTQQRAGLLEASEHMNRRYGSLSQELSQAKQLRRFDEIKLRYQQVRTRQAESAQEYARLLLARRMLESAIAAWESTSQPEVYRQASRLMSLMTDGRWTKVSMTPEGRLQVTDAVKTTLDPVHLSLSTCQQLYLSLRIALLLAADNVGRSVPVLADDILVNFDAGRRLGAARALAELAQCRQVVLFTCHEEIVQVMREACPDANVVQL